MSDLIRNGAHFEGVIVRAPGGDGLIQKNQAVEGDNKDCDDRDAPGRVLIPKRNKHSLWEPEKRRI
jgi:hypothetical protein